MPECESCGEKYRKGDVFCGKCGAKIQKAEPVPKKKSTATSSTATPKKEAGIELTEDVKKRIKIELEGAIKSFKKGEISLEEFQKIKKELVSKARSGAFDPAKPPEQEDTQAPVTRPTPSFQPSTPRKPHHEPPAGELYRPLRRADEPPFSKYWFIVPVVFNIIGGVLAYFSIKGVDEKSAKKMLAIGVVSLVVTAGIGGFYLKSQDMWPFEKKAEKPKGIVIEGEEVKEVEAVPILQTNNSPDEMNLKVGDLGEGFYLNPILSGTIKDPLEFAAGNTSLAEELEAQGWLENHRIVMKKDFVEAGENATVVEKEISSSISKYDANKTSHRFFEEKLADLKEMLSEDKYQMIDFEINESGVMGKKVRPHPDYEVEVWYKVYFYKNDVFVSLSVSKVGRGLEEEEVKGYAELIESRIK